MRQVHVLHGPNLNLLGEREPELYGALSLAELNQKLTEKGQALDLDLSCHQANAESDLIDMIHAAHHASVDYLVFNPAAYTHTSIALRDALLSTRLPFIEVHISNIYQREHFRHHSYFSDIANGVIIGCGIQGYSLALHAIATHFNAQKW